MAGGAKATNVGDLGPAEELIVWAVRSLVEDRRNGPMVRTELRRACGLIGGEAAALALGRMLDRIGASARRDLFVHQPHCACIGEDETMLLALVGRCQARDPARAMVIARRIVPESQAPGLIDEAGMLGDVLAARGLDVIPRADAADDEGPATIRHGPRLTLV